MHQKLIITVKLASFCSMLTNWQSHKVIIYSFCKGVGFHSP